MAAVRDETCANLSVSSRAIRKAILFEVLQPVAGVIAEKPDRALNFSILKKIAPTLLLKNVRFLRTKRDAT